MCDMLVIIWELGVGEGLRIGVRVGIAPPKKMTAEVPRMEIHKRKRKSFLLPPPLLPKRTERGS